MNNSSLVITSLIIFSALFITGCVALFIQITAVTEFILQIIAAAALLASAAFEVVIQYLGKNSNKQPDETKPGDN